MQKSNRRTLEAILTRLTITALEIPNVKIVGAPVFADHRGSFSETSNHLAFSEKGIAEHFIQDNQSKSVGVGTIRGLHFQRPPKTQDKLLRGISGAIWDVAVDMRRSSRPFGRWVAAELSAENGLQLFVPKGFAHGVIILQPDTEVAYKVSNVYSGQDVDGVRWDDPDLAINWPLQGAPILSDKDSALRSFKSAFTFD